MHANRSPHLSIAGERAVAKARPPGYIHVLHVTLIGRVHAAGIETLKHFPPLQKPESYNLTQVMEQIMHDSP